MTQKTQFKLHLETLKKIDTIMTALRNLSFIEMNKASRFLSTQDQIQTLMNQIGNDFLTSYPEYQLHIHYAVPELFVLIGSERGFCGNFNNTLIDYITKHHPESTSQNQFIVVGKKLAEKLGNDKRIIQVLAGPNTIEEISDIIFNVLDTLNLLSLNIKPGSWNIIFNKKNHNSIQTVIQQPYLELTTKKSNELSVPCHINVSPKQFIKEYMNQYLFYLLNMLFK